MLQTIRDININIRRKNELKHYKTLVNFLWLSVHILSCFHFTFIVADVWCSWVVNSNLLLHTYYEKLLVIRVHLIFLVWPHKTAIGQKDGGKKTPERTCSAPSSFLFSLSQFLLLVYVCGKKISSLKKISS